MRKTNLHERSRRTFPAQADKHLLLMLRYVQRNPLRAKLAERAGDWKHGAEHVLRHGLAELRALLAVGSSGWL